MMDRNRRIVGRPLRLIGRPLPNVFSAGAGGVSAAGFQATGIVSISEEAPIEQKVEYLLRREQEAQQKADAIEGRLTAVESRRLAELRRAMEEHVAAAIVEAEGRYRPIRVLGGLALAAGLVCLSVANFV
jgi:hypothetical protein